ncbi:FtsP/CotA-like multicopper oxidase with cupredoxin domain [Stackebrandtia albiflava]|uniref:Multicopper oxidase CueO n=1 Tax=Stackebrandtia albiflava TaxID=406432 RepID=A0A562VB54_9ACTN|nr:multicopper oxidase domain-containing protein [Stackebrandtia albiflava]TWJ15093.1 FtsP/CotA-like multicopper oxidase with cupredoxin domain [Stackebrandtia albiflava]
MPTTPTRRAVLKAAGLLSATAALSGTVAACGTPVDTAGRVDFTRPLPIPPLMDAETDGAGRKVFRITAQAGSAELLPGTRTDTFGYNGDVLGPTLRARRGDEVSVVVTNRLDVPTSVHWHGMHLPAVADGGPHQPIAPGAEWRPNWYVDQPAATLWYHPHPHGETERQVYRGLAGMFILDDDEADRLPLPRDYGVDDIPLVVQDKRFDDSGALDESGRAEAGLLGDTVLVNGVSGPYLDVSTRLVRLRLLNGSTARTYLFGFTDGRRFAVVGSDGGLFAAPHHTDRIMLSPAERAELVVEMTPGERVVMRSFPPDPDGERFGDSGGEQDTLDIVELRAADALDESPELPDRLVDVPAPDPAVAVTTRLFELQGKRINGQRMDMGRIDEVVLVDSVEIWEIHNDHGQYHNFHVHDVQFRVLDVDGEPPPPELAGWKDTVFMPRHGRKRLLLRFADYADPAMPYMYHCHLLRHEDEGMMGQFVVVAPGQEPELSGHGDHD